MTIRKLVVEFDSPDADDHRSTLMYSLMTGNWEDLIGPTFAGTYKPQKDANTIRFIPRNAMYQLVDLVSGDILATRGMSPTDAAGANESLSRELRGTRRWRTMVPDYLADDVRAEPETGSDLFYVYYGPVLIGNLRINPGRMSWMGIPQPGGMSHTGSAEECVSWMTGIYLAADKMKWPKD